MSTPMMMSTGVMRRTSHPEMRLNPVACDCSQPLTPKWTSRPNAPADRVAPMAEAMTPSSRNGIWMKVFDAPTRRMMPVSLRLENAESLMVVAMSSIAHSSMMPAIAIATMVAILSTPNRRSSSWFWSTTSSTPGVEENVSLMMSYFSASLSLTRKDSFISSLGTVPSRLVPLNCSWKCS